MERPPAANINLFTAPEEVVRRFKKLPASLEQAEAVALESAFIGRHLPEALVRQFCD